MKTILYYYTSTGNSLAIARKIAEGLGGAEILPMASFRSAPIKPDAGRIGILFPVYAWGPPRTVEEFLSKLDLSAASYVFAIASCGGTSAGALAKVRKALRARGGKLNAGFALRSDLYGGAQDGDKQAFVVRLVRSLSGRAPERERDALPAIVDTIRAGGRARGADGAPAGRVVAGMIHGMASGIFASADKSYRVAEACTGCGTCARVCPRGNVAMESGRPAWKHDCDACGACVIWCPSKAIAQGSTVVAARGHRPGIELADMLLR